MTLEAETAAGRQQQQQHKKGQQEMEMARDNVSSAGKYDTNQLQQGPVWQWMCVDVRGCAADTVLASLHRHHAATVKIALRHCGLAAAYRRGRLACSLLRYFMQRYFEGL
jgi:hypothetical protein